MMLKTINQTPPAKHDGIAGVPLPSVASNMISLYALANKTIRTTFNLQGMGPVLNFLRLPPAAYTLANIEAVVAQARDYPVDLMNAYFSAGLPPAAVGGRPWRAAPLFYSAVPVSPGTPNSPGTEQILHHMSEITATASAALSKRRVPLMRLMAWHLGNTQVPQGQNPGEWATSLANMLEVEAGLDTRDAVPAWRLNIKDRREMRSKDSLGESWAANPYIAALIKFQVLTAWDRMPFAFLVSTSMMPEIEKSVREAVGYTGPIMIEAVMNTCRCAMAMWSYIFHYRAALRRWDLDEAQRMGILSSGRRKALEAPMAHKLPPVLATLLEVLGTEKVKTSAGLMTIKRYGMPDFNEMIAGANPALQNPNAAAVRLDELIQIGRRITNLLQDAEGVDSMFGTIYKTMTDDLGGSIPGEVEVAPVTLSTFEGPITLCHDGPGAAITGRGNGDMGAALLTMHSGHTLHPCDPILRVQGVVSLDTVPTIGTIEFKPENDQEVTLSERTVGYFVRPVRAAKDNTALLETAVRLGELPMVLPYHELTTGRLQTLVSLLEAGNDPDAAFAGESLRWVEVYMTPDGMATVHTRGSFRWLSSAIDTACRVHVPIHAFMDAVDIDADDLPDFALNMPTAKDTRAQHLSTRTFFEAVAGLSPGAIPGNPAVGAVAADLVTVIPNESLEAVVMLTQQPGVRYLLCEPWDGLLLPANSPDNLASMGGGMHAVRVRNDPTRTVAYAPDQYHELYAQPGSPQVTKVWTTVVQEALKRYS